MRANLNVWGLGLALVGASAVSAAPNRSAVQKPLEIAAVVNSDSYGYDLTCSINGHDLGLKGGQSESQREFAENSKDAEDFQARERGRYAPLHIGRNTVKITYKRKLPKEPFGMEITFEVMGYPAPLFYAHLAREDRDVGTFEGAFDIAAKPPAGFKPLVFTTSDPMTSGLLFVNQDAGGDGMVTPTLNGEMMLQLLGRPHGVIPFSGLHPGANKLTIEYSTKRSPLHLFVLGPKGASLHNLQSAKKTKRTFVIQGPDPAPPPSPRGNKPRLR